MLWNGALGFWKLDGGVCYHIVCFTILLGKLVKACVVLHNIANAHNGPVPQLSHDDWEALQRSQQDLTIADNAESDTRTMLVQRLWAARRQQWMIHSL